MPVRAFAHVELVCEHRCGYEAAVGSVCKSGFRRSTPEECRRCGADLVEM